ncbi:alpha/beta hydrolase [Candidatus Puniceispirillum sp.]|nr:alpha/beta hydrolase [Candidatus Puniceispirillum sp.]
MHLFTPIFIPGLLCTELLFAKQRANLPNHGYVADTTRHDSIHEMALAALDLCDGPLVPVGLSMGGYVALEMARLAPQRMAAMALLSTNCRSDSTESQRQRQQVIAQAKHKGFQGVTRHLMPRLLSEAALQDEAIVADVLAMAAGIGRIGFVQQQAAIMGRRAQDDTLAGFTAPALVLCGNLDVLTPPKLSIEMAGLAPQAELCLLNGIGHLSSIEAPEAVTSALESLFERVAN